MADDLDLQGEWKIHWENYIRGMEFGRICLSVHRDSLLWSHNKYVGPLTAAMGYECITSACCSEDQDPVHDILWTHNIPLKIACFIGFWTEAGY